MVRVLLKLVILFTIGALSLTLACSKSRIYYGSFTKDMGGMVYGYLMFKGDNKAEMHFLGEKETSEGTYELDGDHMVVKFPDPHDPKQFLSLDVVERQTDTGWSVEGRFHWDFGGKMGIDGTVKMAEYKER